MRYPSHISASPKTIFLAQSVDNGATLLLGGSILAAGLSLFAAQWSDLMQNARVEFWVGLMGLFAFCGILYRTFFLIVWGRTPGCVVMGLECRSSDNKLQASLEFLAESLQVSLPGLWVLDVLLRTLDFRAGFRYSFSYELSELV